MKQLIISIIKFYQKSISPYKRKCCRFYPTCSQYALMSVEKFGVIKGGAKAVWRIMRCNPFGGYGVDFPE